MHAVDLALDALGHATRRQIVALLREGPQPVGALARRLPVSRPAVSQHLRVLERARLVAATREGTRHLYRLDPEGLDAARAWLDDLWDRGLAAFAALAEGTWEGER